MTTYSLFDPHGLLYARKLSITQAAHQILIYADYDYHLRRDSLGCYNLFVSKTPNPSEDFTQPFEVAGAIEFKLADCNGFPLRAFADSDIEAFKIIAKIIVNNPYQKFLTAIPDTN